MNGIPRPSADDHEWCMDELSDEEWMSFVAQALAAELADPREDIYDIQDGTSIAEV